MEWLTSTLLDTTIVGGSMHDLCLNLNGRKKLTKLAGNKDVRRGLNKEIKGVVKVSKGLIDDT